MNNNLYEKITILIMSNIVDEEALPIYVKTLIENSWMELYEKNIVDKKTYISYREWMGKVNFEDLNVMFDKSKYFKVNKINMINDIADNILTDEEITRNGIVLTPAWLSSFLLERARKYWYKINGDKEPKNIVDMSCGMGIFLENSLNEFPNSHIKGIEVNKKLIVLLNILFMKSPRINIENKDALIGEINENFEVIIGNPPYVRYQNIERHYSDKLKKIYGDVLEGNYDLTIPFIYQTINKLSSNGVAALIVSNKFMKSKYGQKICRVLSSKTNILEIIDFNDVQLFKSKTTYASVIIFSKEGRDKKFNYIRAQQKEKRYVTNKNDVYFREQFINKDILNKDSWNIEFSGDKEIIDKYGDCDKCELLTKYFDIIQGVRTGNNDIFISKDLQLEKGILKPYVSGENIKKSIINETEKSIIWPYNNITYTPLTEEEFKNNYPKAYSYMLDNKEKLEVRSIDKNGKWYTFSRSQSVKNMFTPKILIKEMMSEAELAVDFNGDFVFSSGYALIPKKEMSKQELFIWSIILNTTVMEFQYRSIGTNLHSRWFRMLKGHLEKITVPRIEFDKNIMKYSDALSNNIENKSAWIALNKYLASKLNISNDELEIINENIQRCHEVSKPKSKNKNVNKCLNSGTSNEQKKNDLLQELSQEIKDKYYPVMLEEFNDYHILDETYKQLVTFKNSKNAPIYRWYNYTQGYSEELVFKLLRELGSEKTDIVYDPFSGSGTTVLACQKKGMDAFGADISPLMVWIAKNKTKAWNVNELIKILNLVKELEIKVVEPTPYLFDSYMKNAYSYTILGQITFIKQWINKLEVDEKYKDFIRLALIGILEEISYIRKHGSHYRFLNKEENIGVNKLNISIINENESIKQYLVNKIDSMIDDVKKIDWDVKSKTNIYNIDSKKDNLPDMKADIVITSPPYLNRNNYFAQQKSEISFLDIIDDMDSYKRLVKRSFCSHIEAELPNEIISKVPEVNIILDVIKRQENNNAKIPNMIAGYFNDLYDLLVNLKKNINKGCKLAFVVGNSRWSGVVVPVDHILAKISTRLGYKVKKIIIARYKGNSPQQMAKYGKIPVRESIVILEYIGD